MGIKGQSNRSFLLAVLALIVFLFLGGCSGGGGDDEAPLDSETPAATTPNEASVVASQITQGDTADEVVTATQKALTLSGVPIADVDEVYTPATIPGGSSFVSPGAAFNMAMEQHNRTTSGRLTVTELGQMLKDFGWPFLADSTPGQQLMLFFGVWVTEAQKVPTQPESFVPLFLYEAAKQQVPPVNLASGTGDPDLMRLTLLELELITAAFDRASVETTSPLSLNGSRAVMAEAADIVTDPCTQMKASFGKLGGGAMGFNWEQTGGEVLGKALAKGGLGEADVTGIGNALSAIGTAARIWKLVQIYTTSEVTLAIAGGDQVHKAWDGSRQLKEFTATAGIPAQDWQDYQKNLVNRGAGGKIEQVYKDCMQTFGFPTIADLGDIAASIDSWKIAWEWSGAGVCNGIGGDYPVCHAYFSQDVNPPLPSGPWVSWNALGGGYKELMTKIPGTASAQAVLKLDINEEHSGDHANGAEKKTTVVVEAAAKTAEMPSLSTLVNAAKGGLGLLDSLVELGAGWLQTMFPPSSTIALTVTYHVPNDDKTAPTVPADLAVTAISASRLNLAWSASTDAVGVTGYKIYRGGTYLKSVTGISASDIGLTASTNYCYEVTAYDAANNESGKSSQVCADTLEGTLPTVIATSPAADETDASRLSTILVDFSEAMDPATITPAVLTLSSGATAIFAYYHPATNTAEFTLPSSLASNTTYTATVANSVKDVAGNAMASNHSWTFTTESGTSSRAILSFSFANPAVTGAIDESTKTISVSVPSGTDVTALVASFITTGASVKIGAAVQVSGTTANNFSGPVAYTVIAEDGSAAMYTVNVGFSVVGWTVRFDGTLSAVRQTSDGGYILAGDIAPNGSVNADAYLVKTDSGGNTLWTKTFGGAGIDRATFVQQTPDGGYIAAGILGTTSGNRGYLIRLDSAGNALWENTLQTDHIYGDDFQAFLVKQTGDGGYLVLGSTGMYPHVIKTDASGNKLWGSGLAIGDSPWAVQYASDGGYIINIKNINLENSNGESTIVKRDVGATIPLSQVWRKPSPKFSVSSIEQTSDGGYILVGGTVPFGDVYLLKIDSAGDIVWTNTFGGTEQEQGHSVQETSDGGYIIAGDADASLYLVKTDSDGNAVWTKNFGGFSSTKRTYVRQTADGGYILAGSGQYGGTYLIKTDEKGNSY